MAKGKTGLGNALRLTRKPKPQSEEEINQLVKKLEKKEAKPTVEKKVTKIAVQKKTSKKVTTKTKEPPKKKEEKIVKTSIHYPESLYRKIKMKVAREGGTIRDYLLKLVEKDLKGE